LGLSERAQPVEQSSNDEASSDTERSNIFGDLNEFIYLRIDFAARDQQLLTEDEAEIRIGFNLASCDFASLFGLIQKRNGVGVNVQTNVINIESQSKQLNCL